MTLQIKTFQEKDKEALQGLMCLVGGEDDVISILESTGLQCAYTAFWEDRLVGSIIAWKSSMHPNCIYFHMVVNPLYQSLPVQEKLFDKVDSLETRLPLQTSLWETTIGTTEFLESKDFQVLRKTYMPQLSVRECSSLTAPIITHGKLNRLREITSDENLLNKLVQLVKYNYEQTHLGNPITELSISNWKQLILADDCDLEGSYVLVDPAGTEILAYSFIHSSGNRDTLELGWCGSLEEDSISLIPQLVLHQIQYAREHGYEFLEGEFDTTSQYAMQVLRTIPFPPCPAWVTYQKIG